MTSFQWPRNQQHHHIPSETYSVFLLPCCNPFTCGPTGVFDKCFDFHCSVSKMSCEIPGGMRYLGKPKSVFLGHDHSYLAPNRLFLILFKVTTIVLHQQFDGLEQKQGWGLGVAQWWKKDLFNKLVALGFSVNTEKQIHRTVRMNNLFKSLLCW